VIWIRQAIGKAVSDKSRAIRVPVTVEQRLRTLEKLTSQLGYVPSDEEAALRLGWTLNAVESAREARHVVVSLNEPVGDGAELGALIPAAPLDVDSDIDESLISTLLRGLGPRERRVLQIRYGLSGGDPESQVETARRLNMRRSEVRRLEEYALSKLRHLPGLATLRTA
jgi:RNA polymerase primary sigma factor